ncbi:serine hydrolase domain-containing protein [Nocardia sp. NPDC051030]|uniref:serine hydrolase domain-containing protein n=1 Tax=Nocardia sp. NPDC051030 TaxID=3155162 RepID=UPI0034138B43
MATASCSVENSAATGPAPAGMGRAAVTDALNRLIADGLPGAQAVVTEGERTWTASAGVGDLEHRTPFPDDARVRIGSNTKAFTATVMLQLVAEGKVDLDTSVERYLPGVVRGDGIDPEQITIRNLLQHTSGLPDYAELIKDWDANRLTHLETAELVRRALTLPAQFQPGEKWNYCNTNYLVAGMVIERVTGSSIDAEITRRIIEPLGLRATYYPAAGDAAIRDPHPSGYEVLDGKRVDVTSLDPSVGGAAGAMVGTGADLNLFFTALLSGKLLPPAQLAEMKRTVPIPAPGAEYGLGLMRRAVSCGKEFWGHGGDIDGFETRGGVTADGRSVTVSVNEIPETDEAIDHVTQVVDAAVCATS